MTPIEELLSALRKQDVRLWLEGERLRFSAPPGVLTPERHNELKSRREEITRFLQRAGAALRTAEERISRGPAGRELPLSFAQQRLWLLEQLQEPSAAYHLPAALRLQGTLDALALRRSLEEILRRHEVLRTCYDRVQGRPVQRVLSPGPVPVLELDLRHLPADERLEEARKQAEAEARRPFNLAQEIPLRPCLLTLGERDHVLLLVLHHIACDGGSIPLFIRELAALYHEYAVGVPAALTPLPVQYSDFAHWQRQRSRDGAFESNLAYWRERLAHAPVLLELPTDRPRPALRRFQGAIRRFLVPGDLATRLKQRSLEQGCTLFMTLLSAFGVLLSRYSRQQDLVIGSPITNRPPEVEPLIGLFVNTLPLRLSLAGNPTFSELLREVRRHTLDAYAHQELPFEQIVEALQPPRDASFNPIYQVLFTLQGMSTERLALSGLSLEPLELDDGAAQLDLALAMAESERGLTGELTYDTQLFDDVTAERMTGHLLTLLDGIAREPSRRIGHLPLLTELERQRLLPERSATARELPPPHTLHGLFEAQALRRPDALAARCDGRTLTYRELDARANRLAHHLRRIGVRPQQRVGIFMDRSLDLLVGLLGILKAGAAYVPVDPMYPAERRSYILEHSGVAVLLIDPRQEEQTQTFRGWTLRLAEAAASPTVAPRVAVGGEHLAYVLYTSGSTGRPKGVAVPHGAVVNLLSSMRREPGMTEADTLFAVTTIAFDISVLELFLPLSVGGCVVMASREVAVDGTRLLPALAESGATVMQATPSTWRMMLELGWSGQPGLKMLCGGEAMPPELVEPLLARGASLWNMYGPTETTVWSTITQLKPGERPSIGRPIDNTQVYVLDDWMQPVPLGVVGTLYIGGRGLARGYLNRPELTSERFIPSPFDVEGGARLYGTGDLVRALPDGSLEFLGRGDDQIKLRGHRIELGEIEAQLAQHAGVQEAAVRLWEVAQDRELVAYLRLAAGAEPDLPSLRQHLQRQLPAYMIPARFVVLEALPRTANGKLDRRALPRPTSSERAKAADHQAPRSAVEVRLAHFWCEVLGVERVGIGDHFFELGGHSMKAVQLLARIQEEWHVDLPLRALFERPTLEDLAKLLESPRAERPVPRPPPLVALPRQARRLPRTDPRAGLEPTPPTPSED